MDLKKIRTKYVIIGICIVIVGALMYCCRRNIERILWPFILAYIISFLIRPVVEKLARRGISFKISVLLVYLFIIFSMIAVFIYVVPVVARSFSEMTNAIPSITSYYIKGLNNISHSIHFDKWPIEFQNAAISQIEEAGKSIERYLTESINNAITILSDFVIDILDLLLALIISYYLIRDSKIIRKTFLWCAPNFFSKETNVIFNEIDSTMSNFFTGQLLTALIVGILEFIGLSILGVKFALILGVVGGFFNMIPYFGPLIGVIPALVIAMFDSPLKALWVFLMFIVVQQLDGAVISTKIIEERMGIHPLITIVAVLIGGEFFGIVGMFLSVPVVAVISRSVKKIRTLKKN